MTERAAIGNNAHADAAISIHADGGPPLGEGSRYSNRLPTDPTTPSSLASAALGLDISAAFLADTGEPVSTYDGINGIQPRDDLAGLNLINRPQSPHRVRQHAERYRCRSSRQ